jgi:hypothetical protein
MSRIGEPVQRPKACRDSIMGPQTYLLAQLNLARTRAPLDSPRMAGFVAQLEHV